MLQRFSVNQLNLEECSLLSTPHLWEVQVSPNLPGLQNSCRPSSTWGFHPVLLQLSPLRKRGRAQFHFFFFNLIFMGRQCTSHFLSPILTFLFPHKKHWTCPLLVSDIHLKWELCLLPPDTTSFPLFLIEKRGKKTEGDWTGYLRWSLPLWLQFLVTISALQQRLPNSFSVGGSMI